MNIIKKFFSFFKKVNKPVITEYPVFSSSFFGITNTVDITRKAEIVRKLNKNEDIARELEAMDYTRIMKILNNKKYKNI